MTASDTGNDRFPEIPPAVWVGCLLSHIEDLELLPSDAGIIRATRARLHRNASTRGDVDALKRLYREYLILGERPRRTQRRR